MKTFKEFKDTVITGNEHVIDEDELLDVQEGLLRTVGGVGLTVKIRNISKEVKNVTYNKSDELEQTLQKMFKKMDLLSKQLLVNSLLVTQLGLMNRK